MKFARTALVALIVSAAPALSAQNLLQNGGFELAQQGASVGTTAQQLFSSGWFAQTTSGTSAFTIFNGSGSNEPAAAEGTKLLNIGGFGTGKGTGLLWQDFATTPGQLYLVSFAFGRSNNSTAAETVSVSAFSYSVSGGVTVGSPLGQVASGNAPATGTVGVLSTVTYSFIADAATSRLLFDDTTVSTGPSLHLDAVSVSAIPEPSTYAALAGAAVLALASMRRRRTAQ